MRFSRAITFLVPFIAFQCIQASGQQVVATWTDATGKWSNPANWSTLTVPNNVGGTTYSVTISATGSVVSGNVVLDPGATLDITLLGGFNPRRSTIPTMDFSTLSGQFANGSSFWDDGYLWDITYQ